jgi:hypothetical protein
VTITWVKSDGTESTDSFMCTKPQIAGQIQQVLMALPAGTQNFRANGDLKPPVRGGA